MDYIKPLRPALFLLLFVAAAAILTLIVVSLGLPDQILILLSIPLVYAVMAYETRVYLFVVLPVVALIAWDGSVPPHITANTLTELALNSVLVPIFCEIMFELTARSRREHVQAEKALRQNEAHLRMLVDTAPLAILVVDQQEQIVQASQHIQLVFGYTPEELIGQPLDKLVPPVSRASHKRQHKAYLAHPQARVMGRNRDLWGIHKDGKRIPVEIGLSHIESDGQRYAIAFISDITERIQAQAALQESEALYRSVFENTSLGLGIADLDGTLLAYNDAVLRPGGYTREDITALSNVTKLYYDLAERIRVFEMAGARGIVEREPVRFKRKDGSPYDTLLTLIPISLKGKQAWHAIVEDVTAQKSSEAEIKRLYAAQQRHVAELEALRQVTLDITRQLDLATLLEALVTHALKLMDGLSGGIYLYRPETDDLELIVQHGMEPAVLGTVLKRGEGLSGKVLVSREPMIVEHYSDWTGSAEAYAGYRFENVVAVPILWGDDVLGVLDANAKPGRSFQRADAELLVHFAEQAAVAINNARLYEAQQAARRRVESLLDAEQDARLLAETLFAAMSSITQELGVKERLESLLGHLRYLVPYDSANIMLFDPGGSLSVLAARGYEQWADPENLFRMNVQPENVPALSAVTTSLESLLIPDTEAYPGWVGWPETAHVKCWLGVPLIVESQVIGAISLDKTEKNYFTSSHRLLVETLAVPAAIAIQNARLIEAERRQFKIARTLQEVGALVTTQMTLSEVFDGIFDLLAGIFDYDMASIFLVDEEDRLSLVGQRGIEDLDQFVQDIQSLSQHPARRDWWRRGTVGVVRDTTTDTRWVPLPASARVRSWMGSALRVKGRQIGILNLDSYQPDAFDEHAAELLEAFGNQAATVIENARLYAKSEERSRRLAILNEITRVGAATLDLDVLLQTLSEQAAAFVGGDGAMVTLWDAARRLTIPAGGSGIGKTLKDHFEVRPGERTLTAITLKRGSPLVIEDLLDTREVSSDYVARLRQAVPIRSILMLPLRADGRDIGALGIDFLAPRKFATDEVAWASQAADLIALAVAKAQAYADLEQRVAQRTGELKAANERLTQLTQLKDEFVSNVSHELRTPIASIKLYHHLLPLRPDKQTSYLEHLDRETSRLEHLVEDMLQLSRLDQERVEFRHERVDVAALAGELASDRQLLAQQKGLSLHCHLRAKPLLVEGDPTLLGQALGVLSTNALNYTPPGGSIMITVARSRRDGRPGAVVTVQDSGPGITPDDKDHLFERFYRGRAAQQSGAPGTGLGLAIAREIVKRHGGSIEVSPVRKPGTGSKFTIWLPLAV